MTNKLIVTGGTGHLGQLVVNELLTTHKVAPGNIIMVSRKVEALEEWKKKGVDTRKGDFDDPASLKAAFQGGNRLLIVATNTPGPGRPKQHENAIREAVAAGVKHILFTSMITPAAGTKKITLPDLHETEELLKKTQGITYTLLGFNFWMETQLELYAPAIASGTLYTTSGAGKAAHISREDYAKACAAALASKSTKNEKFELSGSECLDRRQLVTLINKALGLAKPIQIVEVSESEIFEKLKAQYGNDMYAHIGAMFDGAFAQGEIAVVHHDYHKLTGKHPAKFSEFLERHKAEYAPKK